MLNKQKGNMYGWVTHTWNPIKGKCPHDCCYCYMKVFPQGELRFDEKCMKDDLSSGNYIFVGSSTDMFAEEVPDEWIVKTLDYCKKFDNTYLFQSKNPHRLMLWKNVMPNNVIFGTTIETNYINNFLSKAPLTTVRAEVMKEIKGRKMVSIEPICDFKLDFFVDMIKEIKPEFVSIGADSKGHNLPEPSWEKVQQLITELKKFTEVKVKDNLMRLKK